MNSPAVKGELTKTTPGKMWFLRSRPEWQTKAIFPAKIFISFFPCELNFHEIEPPAVYPAKLVQT